MSTRAAAPLSPVSPSPKLRRLFRRSSSSERSGKLHKPPRTRTPSPARPVPQEPLTPPPSPKMDPSKKVLSPKTWFASAKKRDALAALPPLDLPSLPLSATAPLSPASSRASASSNEKTPASSRWSLSSFRRRSSNDKTLVNTPSPSATKQRKSFSDLRWSPLSSRRKSSRGSSSSSSLSDSPSALPTDEKKPLSFSESDSSRPPSPVSSLDLGPARSSTSSPVSSIYDKGKNKDDTEKRGVGAPAAMLFDGPPSISPVSTFDLGIVSSSLSPASSTPQGKNKDSTEKRGYFDADIAPRRLFADSPSPARSFDSGSSSPSPASSTVTGKNKDGLKKRGAFTDSPPTTSPASTFDLGSSSPSPASSTFTGKNKDGLKKRGASASFTDGLQTISPASTFDLGAAPPSPASSISKGKNKDGTQKKQRKLFGALGRRQNRPGPEAIEMADMSPSPSSTLVGGKGKGKQRAASTPVASASSTLDEKHRADETSPYTFDLPRASTFGSAEASTSAAASAHTYPPTPTPAGGLRRRRKPSRKGKERATDSDAEDDADIAPLADTKRVTFSIADTADTAVASPTVTGGSMVGSLSRPSRLPRRQSSATYAETGLAVASLTFRAFREVADGLNIPYAKGIAGLAVLITDSVQLVTTNKEACERLAEHVCQVVTAIINQMNGKDNISPQLKYNIEHLTQTLQKIHKFVQEQSKRTYFSRFVRSQDDVTIIQQYSDDLRHALDLFGLRSTIIIQHQLHRSAAVAQEYDTKILETVQRNHAMYMRVIRGGSGSVEEIEGGDVLSEQVVRTEGSEEVAVEGQQEAEASTSEAGLSKFILPVIDWEEPLLRPRPQIFYGREAILEDIVNAIAPSDDEPSGSSGPSAARLAVLGAPGIGKSSLALTALHHARAAARYEQRRYFVACDSATDASSLLRVLADHFEMEVAEGAEDSFVQDMLLARLRCKNNKPAILVLDNLESPWEDPAGRDAVEKVLIALAGLQNLGLIVTLRGAERPMGPGWTRPFLAPIAPLDNDAARKTFIALSDVAEDEPILPKLLDRCAGHPLALSLLANIAQYDSMSAIAARWEQESTSMLERGPLDRRTNFDVCIEVSLKGARMTAAGEPALDLMALVCMLPDGVSEDTLADIGKGVPELNKVVSVLRQTSLAYDDHSVMILPPAPLPAAALAASPTAKFLESHKATEPREARRLRVLNPVRSYFTANRKPCEAHVAVLEAHYIALAARAATIGTAEDGEVLSQVLRLEVGNMHCIIERILEKDPHRRDAIQAAADLGAFLRHTLHGSLRSKSFQLALKASQAIGEDALKGEWMVRAAEAARERGDVQSAVMHFEAARAILQDVRGQAHCVKQWALALVNTDNHALAKVKLEEARALYQVAGDVVGQGECLVHLADCAITADDMAHAQTLAEDAMRTFRKNPHATWQARCQKVLGIVAQRNGNLKLAASKFSAALTLFKKAGCAPEVADALSRLAQIASARGDFADALSANDDVLTMVRGFGRMGMGVGMGWGPVHMPTPAAVSAANREREAQALLELGKLALTLNNLDLARSRFEEAAAIFGDAQGNVIGQAEAAVGLGDLSMKLNDPEDALARYQSARTIYRRIRAPRWEAEVLAKIGDARHALRTDFEAGFTAHIAALAMYRKTRVESGIAGQLRWLGDYTLAGGAPKAALAAYHVAGSLCRRATDWRLQADLHVRVGDVCVSFDNREGARERYDRALAMYRKSSDTRAIQQCEEKIEELGVQ